MRAHLFSPFSHAPPPAVIASGASVVKTLKIGGTKHASSFPKPPVGLEDNDGDTKRDGELQQAKLLEQATLEGAWGDEADLEEERRACARFFFFTRAAAQ